MNSAQLISLLIQASYFVAAVLLIMGIKRMSSPVTARSGIQWAGVGVLVAVIATFFHSGMHHVVLMLAAIIASTALAWYSGKKVAMTDMPQMVALYNGMGGGSAAAIGASALLAFASMPTASFVPNQPHVNQSQLILAVLGALIGSISFTGSLIAFAKLQGWMDKTFRFPGQQVVNGLCFLAAVAFGAMVVLHLQTQYIVLFFAAALLFGILMTLPIGGADMPVVISLLNAFTGTAVAMAGFVIDNWAMIIAGALVGASGGILTKLMADAMNRSIGNIIVGGFGTGDTAVAELPGAGAGVRAIEADDAAIQLAYAAKVIIVPGYGLAAAQAQHAVAELADVLESRGVEVSYAIHPVAGRMPGHMNVLLAEANVPYPQLKEMDEINPEFARTDVALVIGANDVTNPAARRPGTAISGMPILDVDQAKNIIVIKRSMGQGYAGIDNELYVNPKTSMYFADAKKALAGLTSAVKTLVG